MRVKERTVLLVNPPSDQPYSISVQPPLGLLYIAAYLRKYGCAVAVLDLNVRHRWKTDLLSELRRCDPAIVGLTSNVSSRLRTRQVARLVKEWKQDTAVVAGGPHPTAMPKEYVGCGIDYILPFEGEKKMLEFVLSGASDKVPGIVDCRTESSGAVTPPSVSAEYVSDLDTLPFPAYDLIDISRYHVNSFKQKPIVSMVTSRGCPCHCTFCSQAVFGRQWRARSPENVVEEMVWLQNHVGAREISIEDDNFTLDMDRVSKICRLIEEGGVKVPWQLANGIRADRVTRELLLSMKEAGCWKIAIAPEVGDDASMKKIRKDIALDRFRQVAAWCKELGIVYYGFFLMGFPFQAESHVRSITDFAIELDPDLMDLSKIVPFPGTELYKEMKTAGHFSPDSISSYYEKAGNGELDRWHFQAYARFYLRPLKLWRIIRTIGFRQFWGLVRYGMRVFLSCR